MNYSNILIPNEIIDQLGWLEEDEIGFTVKDGSIIVTNMTKENKKRRCSHCDDSGLVSQYDKDGGVFNMPCPRCTEDEMSHIRNWGGQMFDG